MKKNDQDTRSLNSDINSNQFTEQDKIKTTNVNILLNRVRLDEKKALRKKIYFSFILIILISLLAIYFNI